MSFSDLTHSLPFLWPVIVACAILVLARRNTSGPNPLPPILVIVSSILAAVTLLFLCPEDGESTAVFGSALRFDGFAYYLAFGATFCGFVTALVSGDYLKRRDKNHPEFYALLLFATSGMIIMSMSTNLLALLLGLEIMSVALYILAGFFRDSSRSIESSIKYYLTGSFATGIFVFGLALIFGGAGSLDLADLGKAMRASDHSSVLLLGAGFLAAAFAFKVAAVPFHMWLPDVYEGAPTNVTGFMATGVKIATFGALVRVFAEFYQQEPSSLRETMWWIALLTMAVGNIAAISQSSVKRMLAYSSIAHAGYLLIGIVSMIGTRLPDGRLDFTNCEGVRGILFYVIAYAFANLGAFGALSNLERADGKGLTFDDLAGMRTRQPLVAFVLSLFMFSLAGIPATAGFMGKFLIFRSAMDAQLTRSDESFTTLAILGIVNSLISLYYYLRVPIQCYVAAPPQGPDGLVEPRRGFAMTFVLIATAFLTLWFGLFPEALL